MQLALRAFPANIVDAYGDEQLLTLELCLQRHDKVPNTGTVSFELAENQVRLQLDTVGATHTHAPIFFQTPLDTKHQARAVLTRNRQSTQDIRLPQLGEICSSSQKS